MLAHFEKVTRDHLDGSFFCRHFDGAAFDAPWHFHPEWELTLILEGGGQRFVGDSVAAFGPGDFALLGPDLPHCWLSLPTGLPPVRSTPGARARTVVTQFDGDLLGAGWQERPELRAVDALFARHAARGVVFTGPEAAPLAVRVAALPGLRGLDRLLELLSILDALAHLPEPAATPLASEGYAPALNLRQAQRLETVCRFVHERFRETIRLAEVAALAHLTPEAFSRFFRQKARRSFVDYLNDVRVGQACRLLIERDTLGITQICYACGFGNVSNFNRHFRLRHGTSPREYRRRFAAAAPPA